MTPAGQGGVSSGLLEAPLGAVFQPMMPRLRRVALLSIVGAVLALAPAVYMLEVYDRVINSRSMVTLLMLSLLVVVVLAVMELLEWVRSETLQAVGRAADQVVSPRLFRLIFEANLRRQPGGQQQTLQDWKVVREFLHSPFVLAVLESPVALLFLLLVYLINPLLGWVTLAAAVVQVGLAWLTNRSTYPPLKEANRSALMAQQYADSSLRNAEVIEAMGMLRNIHARWIRHQLNFLRLQAQASLVAGGLQALSKSMQMIVSSALLGLSAWLLLRNSLSGGPAMMIVASIIGGRVLTPLVQMVGQWQLMLNARESWIRLNAVMASMPPKEPSMPLPAPQGVLTVEHLVAGAPPPPGQPPQPILRGIHFTAIPGELVAVIGPSASGKTTLARLLVGLWPALAGKVRLDGADVHAWNKDELGPHIGYLPQGVELFEGTVAENIARFGEIDNGKVHNAARLVGMHHFIESLPQGYETQVGRDGAVLSGGQRQRIALARAVYGDPALIVLDEPNSSLDEAGDAALAQALRALKARHATVIVVTHRTSVLGLTDKILLLREGQQQAFGPRDEVMSALQKAQQQAQTSQRAAPQGTAALPSPSTAGPKP